MKKDLRRLAEMLGTEREGVAKPVAGTADFEEEPVPLRVFITDRGYMAGPELSPKQYALVARGTQIYFEETLKALGHETFPYYKELVAMWGKGGGKDHCARNIIARIAYLLLCLRCPQAYYGLPATSTIGFINMARSAPQASNVFFVPLKRMFLASPWFKNKIVPRQSTIEFEKNLIAISGHSEMEQHEGYDLIAGVLDEIAAFKTDKECEIALKRSKRAPAASARAIYEGIKSSIVSRFPLAGKLILISYTRFRGDFIWQRYYGGKAESEEAIKEGRSPAVYTTYARTWEVHPARRKEDFDDEYRRDAVQARAKYECDPPLAEDAFFKDADKLRHIEVWRPEITNPVMDLDAPTPVLRPEYRAFHSCKCGAHIDLALKRDAAGLAVVHQSEWRERIIRGPSGVTRRVEEPVLEVDLVCKFQATGENKEIDIEQVIDMIFQMISRGFNIGLVSMDGFQSAQALQTFEKAGIEPVKRSLDNFIEPWNNLKDLIYDKRLRAYPHPSLLEELESLTYINARKIDHTDISTKDEADAICGACESAVEIGLTSVSHADFWSGAPHIFAGVKSPFEKGLVAFEDEHMVQGVDTW